MQTELALKTDLRQRLAEELAQIRMRNPSYSLRAFARKVGISASALSEILSGKRNVSQFLALRIADRMMWSPETVAELSRLPRYRKRATNEARPNVQLSMDNFHAISDWHHYAIISLVETEDFREQPEWIAHRLGIARSVAQQALERLERLGMVERRADGRLITTGVTYNSPDEVASVALRKAHAQNLELARNSLEQDALTARDFTAVTMAIDPDKIPEAKKMIRSFRDELCAYLEGGTKKEVYKFCMQFIPLSKNSGEKP
ncbi:MAG: TIGR02147 family protein [Bdellovibrionota bacterium]